MNSDSYLEDVDPRGTPFDYWENELRYCNYELLAAKEQARKARRMANRLMMLWFAFGLVGGAIISAWVHGAIG